MKQNLVENSANLMMALGAITVIIIILLKRRNQTKRIWTRSWIKLRQKNGVYFQLLLELENEDNKSLKNFLRMDKSAFDNLVERIHPFVYKQNTWFRNAISVEERLALTLRYLATGMKIV